MAVKHDALADNQNGAQAKENVHKLHILLRLLRSSGSDGDPGEHFW